MNTFDAVIERSLGIKNPLVSKIHIGAHNKDRHRGLQIEVDPLIGTHSLKGTHNSVYTLIHKQ